jgi:hypothetical protein
VLMSLPPETFAPLRTVFFKSKPALAGGNSQ